MNAMVAINRVSARSVIEYVAAQHGLDFAVMTGVARANRISRPRQVAMYCARTLCPHVSMPMIGRLLGGRDHTTILHGIRKIESLLPVDDEIREEVAKIIAHFRLGAAEPRDLMLSAQIDAASKHLEVLITEARARVDMARLNA